MQNTFKQPGFSLVELSIVLVILGLLTGGILGGQALIRAAELRSLSVEIAKQRTALQTFRDKYFAVPGDMPNATAFWGAANAAPATCKTTASTNTATCDGDGNGQVNDETAGSYERLRYFHHLANAGLIEGSYSGVTALGGSNWNADRTNSPQLRIANSGISVMGPFVVSPLDVPRFEGSYPVTITMGSKIPSWEYAGGFIRPEEAWNIDIKLDDGKPAFGSIRSEKRHVLCNTSTSPTTAEYMLTESGTSCSLDVFLQ